MRWAYRASVCSGEVDAAAHEPKPEAHSHTGSEVASQRRRRNEHGGWLPNSDHVSNDRSMSIGRVRV